MYLIDAQKNVVKKLFKKARNSLSKEKKKQFILKPQLVLEKLLWWSISLMI
ncbi:hypothetical protein [Mesomycoplasma hyopneumoniae]|uniref:hypothetical protein n=1 Tax=Mesomycoplasma hyopneumoniae TaxID=2099 RepID=UPI003857DA6B